MAEGPALRGRDEFWKVNDTAALGGAVKGTSGQPILQRLVALFWILSYRFRVNVWVEYVDSHGNWSDGISRLFAADPFVAAHGFQIAQMKFEVAWLLSAYPELWRDSRRFDS